MILIANHRMLISSFMLILSTALSAEKQPMVISVPIANLRATPEQALAHTQGPALSGDLKTSNNESGQISQLLFGEPITAEITPQNPNWLAISALEQTDTHGNPLRGYVEKYQATRVEAHRQPTIVVTDPSAHIKLLKKEAITNLPVPFGTKLSGNYIEQKKHWLVTFSPTLKGIIHEKFVRPLNTLKRLSKTELRKSIVAQAKKLIDTPYVWGGKSMQQSNMFGYLTGIDCSNLVNLIMSMHSITVPRNSQAQKNNAQEVATGKKLQPGDLIFFTSNKSSHISHVVLYAGNDMIINPDGLATRQNFSYAGNYAPEDQKKLYVRFVSLSDYVGIHVTDLINGMNIKHGVRAGARLFLGSFINENNSAMIP